MFIIEYFNESKFSTKLDDFNLTFYQHFFIYDLARIFFEVLNHG